MATDGRKDRSAAAHAAADTLEGALGRGDARVSALAGFDGCVDSIIRVVRRRHAPGPAGFERMESMAELARKIADAAGRSANIEFVVERRKIGGNGVIAAGALAALGAPVAFIGNVGAEEGADRLHPVFDDFAARCERVVNLGPVGFTDALEFNDGKLLLGKIEALDAITLDAIVRAAGGADALVGLLSRAKLICMGNWTMTAGMNDIWRGLAEKFLPRVPDAASKRVFIDLADPAKRSDDDLREAAAQLRAIDRLAPLTLGLNIAEAGRIAALCGARHTITPDDASPADAAHTAASIREKVGVSCVCVHFRRGAGAATTDGDVAGIEGPFVKEPKISTGAGDHFNAGFGFAQALGAPIAQCLAAAVAVSGLYIRTGESPSLDKVIAFLRELPAPEA